MDNNNNNNNKIFIKGMPRGGCATGGRECAPHAHQELKTSGNKRKTERKRNDERKTDEWAKDGPMGKKAD
jgi:hypothetical protein